MDPDTEKRILIVDDSRTIRRMVATSLADLKHCRIYEAASGLEAIERLAVGPPDLMVLDLNMPEMHGIEVLKFMRARPAYRNLPVVVLTTKGDSTSRNEALAAGANLYLTKPFSSGELQAKVRELLVGLQTEE